MLKLFDSNVNSLNVIQFYEPTLTHDPRLDKFIIPTPPKKDVLELQEKGEGHENYYLQNSLFIRSVENQPPPVE